MEYKRLEDILDYIQPTNYIVESEKYDDSFKTPVLTAGKSFLLGYTDEINGIFNADFENPIILFDDFTTDYKWVDFAFKVKSSACKILIPKTNVNLKYVFYAMKYVNIDTKLHKRYWISIFSKQLIPYPDNEIQTKIVMELDKIHNQIKNNEEELMKFDEIVKSQFIEMFGDPKVNPNGYEIKKISDIFNVGSSKRVFESEWTDSGVPFYRAREIVKLSKDGYVDNELYITEEMYDNYKKKYGVPQEDDMMVTGVGTLGICYIVKKEDKFYFKDGNTLWFKNKGLCNVRFIRDQYNTDFVREQIEANANASTVGTYTITNANNTRVLVPPIDLQNEYVSFCEVIDKSKYFGGVNYGIC